MERETHAQLEEAIAAAADIVLLDTIRRAVQIANGRVMLEVAGNVTLATVPEIARTSRRPDLRRRTNPHTVRAAG